MHPGTSRHAQATRRVGGTRHTQAKTLLLASLGMGMAPDRASKGKPARPLLNLSISGTFRQGPL